MITDLSGRRALVTGSMRCIGHPIGAGGVVNSLVLAPFVGMMGVLVLLCVGRAELAEQWFCARVRL